MLVERLPAGDNERVGDHGLDADLVAAGLDRLLDVGGDALLQLGEELVLLGDGQCQQAVQELRHRRQVVLEPALVDDLEAGRVLEALDVPALDAPAPERAVELPQGSLGVGALQVVALAEQRGIAAAHGGLAVTLASRDGAQAVEPPGDGGDEPPLALHVRGDGTEERCRGLVRAVGDGGDLASLAAAGAVAEHPAPAEAHRVRQGLAVAGDEGRVDLVPGSGPGQALIVLLILAAAMDGLPARADAVLRGEMPGVGLAGQHDALQLGVGQQALGDDPLGQHRAPGRGRMRHGRHCGGLHERRRMLLTNRKFMLKQLCDAESNIRGTLRNFGLKVGKVRRNRPHPGIVAGTPPRPGREEVLPFASQTRIQTPLAVRLDFNLSPKPASRTPHGDRIARREAVQ